MDRTIHPALNSVLEEFTNDPNARNQAMARFSQPPPPYTRFCPPAATTEFGAGNRGRPRSSLTRAELRMKLDDERGASYPSGQWTAQWRDEETEVENDARTKLVNGRINPMYIGRCLAVMAKERLKARWVEQGIWREEWREFPRGPWKHEEPLPPDSCSGSESESETPPRTSLFGIRITPPPPRPRPKRSESEILEAARQREVRRRARDKERNASRPFEQFLYQLQRESQRLEANLEDIKTANLDVNALAFQNVRQTWMKWKIWDDSWCGFPGLSWKHERPLVMPPIRDPSPHRAQPPENQNLLRGLFSIPANTSAHQEVRPPVETRNGVTSEQQHAPAAAPLRSPRHSSIRPSIEDHVVDNEGEPDSSRMRDGSSHRSQSRPAPTAPSEEPNGEQNAATEPTCNNVASPPETEPMAVDADASSPPRRRSRRLQSNNAKETTVPSPSPEQTRRPARQTRRQSASASQPRGVAKRSKQSKPRKQGKRK